MYASVCMRVYASVMHARIPAVFFASNKVFEGMDAQIVLFFLNSLVLLFVLYLRHTTHAQMHQYTDVPPSTELLQNT